MAKVREIPAASDGDNNGSQRNETVSNPTHGRESQCLQELTFSLPAEKIIDLYKIFILLAK